MDRVSHATTTYPEVGRNGVGETVDVADDQDLENVTQNVEKHARMQCGGAGRAMIQENTRARIRTVPFSKQIKYNAHAGASELGHDRL